uniref:DEAD/DEAH box helicase n=1 Tax=Streptomyces sp. NBC_00093 TaxID=2975649 RepID=A0AAU2AC06_9ACTN
MAISPAAQPTRVPRPFSGSRVDLGALEPQVFCRLLEKACTNRLLPAELAAEAALRAGAGRLGVKELRMILLQVPQFVSAHAAVDAAWTLVGARPEVATSVLHSHGQGIGDPAAFVVRDLRSAEPEIFRAQAGWHTSGAGVHGAVVARTSKKAAHQYAAVSLLGHLSGVELVEQIGMETEKGWLPAARYAADSAPAQARDQSFATRLQGALAQPRVAPAVVAEVAMRVTAGALIPRDLHAVLFGAVSPEWAPARRAVLQVAATEPGTAVAVLTLYQSMRNCPNPTFTEERKGGGAGLFRARVTCVIDDETVSLLGPWHPSKARARGAAAVQFLADLAELPLELPSDRRDPAVQGEKDVRGTTEGPLDRLRAMEDSGLISGLTLKEEPSVTGLEPLFVCVAACVSQGRLLSGAGRSVGRASARLEAAEELLGALTQAASPAGKNPLLVLNELKQNGQVTKLNVEDPQLDPEAGFVAVITCRARGRGLRTQATASTKRAAQRGAAKAMVELLATTEDAPSRAAASETSAAGDADRLRHGPAGPVALPSEADAARAALSALLQQGAEVTIDVQGATTRFLVYRPDGLPLETVCHRPIRPCTATLVLPVQGAAVGPRPVECWQVPVRLLANALESHQDREKEALSVQVWRQVIRLGLQVVASRRVFPSLADDGTDVWRAGPLTADEKARARELRQAMVPSAHCGAVTDTKPYRMWAPRAMVRAGLDAVAEAMLRGPGTSVVVGSGPFTAAVPQQQRDPALVQWADDLEDGLSSAEVLELVLLLRAPKKDSPSDTELLWADLYVRQPDSPIAAYRTRRPAAQAAVDLRLVALIRRRLRRIAAAWPPAERLLEQLVPGTFTLRAAEAVLLRGRTSQELQRCGLQVEWHRQWTDLLRTRAVLGRRPPCPPSAARPTFSLDEVLDGRWQLSVDGNDLSEEEMDDLARIPVPLAKVRDQWVLVDEETATRAGDRQMPPITSGEALRASLTGTIDVDGQTFACEPAEALAELVEFLRNGSRTSPVRSPAGLEATMRGYQHLGLAWLANTTDAGFGALLADDMGLGKSLTALALHLHRRDHDARAAGPTLIVCPASMVINWEREVHRFAPSAPTLRYHGPDRTLDDATPRTLVITTYETLRRDIDLLVQQPFDMIVADEAQVIKNHRTATALAMRRLKATVRIALTGTPVENNLTEAWAVMDWLNPGLFGTLRTFRDQYARPIEENITDTELTTRLSALLKAFMLRRRKSDPGILTELPPKIVSPRIVSLSPEQAALYQKVADETFREIRSAEGVHRKGLLLTLFNRLQQICNAPAQYLNEPQADTYAPEHAAARSGKLAALDDLLPVLCSPDDSTLIFTRYRSMARYLVRHLRAHGLEPLYFSGDIAAGRDRQRIIDMFQSRLGQTMVMTVKAGGSGLTLTRASHVVLFDRPWNPAKESQAIDRAHRLGQLRTVTVHQLITENTLEDRVDELLRHKQALADAVLADGYSALTELTDEQICDLIALGAQR